jgi:hypothetical protein
MFVTQIKNILKEKKKKKGKGKEWFEVLTKFLNLKKETGRCHDYF